MAGKAVTATLPRHLLCSPELLVAMCSGHDDVPSRSFSKGGLGAPIVYHSMMFPRSSEDTQKSRITTQFSHDLGKQISSHTKTREIKQQIPLRLSSSLFRSGAK